MRRASIQVAALLAMASSAAAHATEPEAPFTITTANLATYRALLPESIAHRVELGQYTIPVAPVDPARFRANYTERFWKASAANAGKYHIDAATGGLADATGTIPAQLFGLPFPSIEAADPQAGTKIVHNYRMRRMQADGTQHVFDLTDVKVDGEVLRTVKESSPFLVETFRGS